jgi:hypothetical protein
MSLKISEYTVEQTTIADTDKQELSTETSPSVWETRWYSITTLLAKIKTWAFGDWIKPNLATNDDLHVPTVKAVVDAIALQDLQAVTDNGAETDNPLLVRQAGDTQNLFRKNGILHTSEATGGTSTWLSFNTPTGTGNIAIQDAGNASEVLAFMSDIPAPPATPTLEQVVIAGNTSSNSFEIVEAGVIGVNHTTSGFIKNDYGTGGVTYVNFNNGSGTTNNIGFQDGSGVVAFLSDITAGAGSPVPISRIDLDALITGGILALNTCYSVPSASGAKQYLVWSNTVSSLYHASIKLDDGMFGTYDFPSDGFTPMSASVSWGAITGTLSSQTDLQTALNGKVDENTAITGATKTKVTYDSKGLITSATDATTADIADSTNKRYVTDAQLTKIGFISVTQAVDLDTIENDTVINNAKVSNATHTGEVTGSGALVVDKTAITNKTLVTAASGDKILIADISDSENLKYVTAQSIASLAANTVISGTAVVDFGSENDWATLTIANASITTAAIKNISIIPIETTATSLDDFAINNVTFGIENIIDNTSFVVRGIAGNNASGNYTVNYLITI